MTTTVTIDSTVTSQVGIPPREQIVISDTVIYQFYCDVSGSDFCWRKTTDGGLTWSSPHAVGGVATQWHDIYYERWNGSDKQNVVHLACAWDGSTRGIYYSSLNLDTEVLSTPVLAIGLTALPGEQCHGLGVARDGTIRVDATQAAIFGGPHNGAYSTDGGVTWNTTGNKFAEGSTDKFTVWADFAGDPEDLIAIYWDDSANEFSVKRWDKSANTVTETAIGTVTESEQFGSALLKGNGHIYLAALDIGATTSIKTWDIYGTSITARTDVVTASTFIKGVALAVNIGGKVRCYYGQDNGLASFSSLEVYYQESTDAMVTWGSQTAYGGNSTQLLRVITDPGPTSFIAPAWQTSGILYIESLPSEWTDPPITGTIPPVDSNGGGTHVLEAPPIGIGNIEVNDSDAIPSDQTLDSNPSDDKLLDSNPSDDAGLFA